MGLDGYDRQDAVVEAFDRGDSPTTSRMTAVGDSAPLENDPNG